MPRPGPDAAVTLSVFDRLIDADPRNSSEAPLTRAQSVQLLRDGVRRDLEWLLNSRQVAFAPPDGLPDFTGYNLGSAAAEAKLTRQLQSALKFFEPRLARVRVVPIEPLVAKTRTFRFRIEALLMMDPAPEHISFDTVLQLTTNQYEVQNAG
jgi:type VI secretion system protein ImpF